MCLNEKTVLQNKCKHGVRETLIHNADSFHKFKDININIMSSDSYIANIPLAKLDGKTSRCINWIHTSNHKILSFLLQKNPSFPAPPALQENHRMFQIIAILTSIWAETPLVSLFLHWEITNISARNRSFIACSWLMIAFINWSNYYDR